MADTDKISISPEERDALKAELLTQLDGVTYKNWIKPFLTAYSETGIIGVAARSARITRSSVEKLRSENRAFAALMLMAREDSIDMMEAVAKTRAIHGTRRLVLHHGKAVKDPNDASGTKFLYETKSSDALMIFLLKKYRYPDQVNHTHTGAGGGPIKVQHTLKHEEIMKKVRGQIAAAPQLAIEAQVTEVPVDDAVLAAGDDDPELAAALKEQEDDE